MIGNDDVKYDMMFVCETCRVTPETISGLHCVDRFRDFVRVLFHPNEKVFLNLAKGRLPIGSPASDLSRDPDSDV